MKDSAYFAIIKQMRTVKVVDIKVFSEVRNDTIDAFVNIFSDRIQE